MAPKRKASSSSIAVIPPIDPNCQLPFAGNHMSVVSESDLLHLVSIGVLPPKELCSWRICHGVTVPTEDTHESVVYVPFLLRGLALPISPFFRGLLDFYHLNLTHLNPNSILQIYIFVHLCEAFLGILPHFGLWKYLYHCRLGMAGGQHQLVGGASLEMRRGRKTDYLDIPLKDSIKGWRLEWFIVENHGNSEALDSKALDIQRPVSVRPKCPCRANQPASPADGQKKKKRHLRRVSSLDRDAGPSAPAAEEVPMPEFTEVDPNGCDPSDADPNGCAVRVANEDEEEEEDEIPLIRKNSRRYIASGENSGVPSPALSALIGLQELSLANFDQTLEDMVLEDLLSEPADGDAMDVCADVLDAGLGSSRVASHASSTLERGLEGQEADLGCPAPMEVTEGTSA
jgi:hypothetical protein